MLSSIVSLCSSTLRISKCASSTFASKQFFKLYENDTHSVMESRNTNLSVLLTNSSARGNMINNNIKSSVSCENKLVRELFGHLLHIPYSEGNNGCLTTINALRHAVQSKDCQEIANTFNSTLKAHGIKNQPKLLLEFTSFNSSVNHDCTISYCSAGNFADAMANLLNKSGLATGIEYSDSLAAMEDCISKEYPPSVVSMQLSSPIIQDPVKRKKLCKTIVASLCKIPHFAVKKQNVKPNQQAVITSSANNVNIETPPQVKVLHL